jgi:hypothetical protein
MRKAAMVQALAIGLLSAAAGFAAEATKEGGYQPKLDKDGWEILFDGKELDAWIFDPKVWTVTEQGELCPVKGGGNIISKQRYCDFVLEVDFKVAPKMKSNSGVFIRVHNPHNEVNTGMEIQILDNADYGVKWDAMNACGALYDLVHPSVDANSPLGEWNRFRITCNDNLITIELNGKEIVKADLNQWTTAHVNPGGGHNKFPYAIGLMPREGFIELQNYGGKAVWFRNIRLKALSGRKPEFTGKEPMADVIRKAETK